MIFARGKPRHCPDERQDGGINRSLGIVGHDRRL